MNDAKGLNCRSPVRAATHDTRLVAEFIHAAHTGLPIEPTPDLPAGQAGCDQNPQGEAVSAARLAWSAARLRRPLSRRPMKVYRTT